MKIINKNSKIYIAGHNGMVGKSCWNTLYEAGYKNLIGKSSKELDLRNQNEVFSFIENQKPDIIIDAAAKVGGILANDNYPYDFLIDNMLIQNNLINSAHLLEINKFIFLGSSCIYPKFSEQPIKEEYLLSSSLEPTNEWYAIAKISGVKLIEAINKQFNKNYIALMPTNLYGPHDNFDLYSSHVVPAMIRKFHEAKLSNSVVNLWGTGLPRREFMHVDDLASAVLFSIENKLEDHIYNVGYGSDISILELSKIIKKITGFNGDVKWDKSKPDGTPKKLMDNSKLKKIGWEPKIFLEDGIRNTYQWYLKNISNIKQTNIL